MKYSALIYLFKYFRTIVRFIIVCCLCSSVYGQNKISVVTDDRPDASVLHGIEKLTDVLKLHKVDYEIVSSLSQAKGNIMVVAGLANGSGTAAQLLKVGNHEMPKVSEALTVWKTSYKNKPAWVIGGFDNTGLMYGLLDFAMQSSWGKKQNPFGSVKEVSEKPEIATRAISLFTMNRAYWESRFYDTNYWKQYFDMLSQNRFNSLVIIFGYENGGFLAPPYPYFFNVGEFPDVKMTGLSADEQLRNLKTLNELIAMAHSRGIKISVAIWDHIYRGGIQSGDMNGGNQTMDKPTDGLVWGLNSQNLIPYTKAALSRLIKLVPNLDGIEFRMHGESGLKESEEDAFWADIFKSMKAVAPKMNFVLRAKGMPETVIQSALHEGINFKIETKYWMEQMGMPWHPTHINTQNQKDRRQGYADMLRYPQDYKMYWRLWTGGTSRVLLWGDPDYARRFVESTKLYGGDAYEVNEPLATKMESMPHTAKPFDLLNPQYRYYTYEFERYWHFYQVFGRMGYNPNQSPDIWDKEFVNRYGEKAGPVIEKAIHEASWILPRIVASCYPYGSFPTTRGWAEKQCLGNLSEYANGGSTDLQQFASFDEEAKLLIENGETAKVLPSMTSLWFKQVSDQINSLVTKAEKAIGTKPTPEFKVTLTDLNILSNLALYHSRRIPAAVSYRIFARTKNVDALDKAIEYEKNAIEAWQKIVESAGDVYTDNLMMGIGSSYFDGLTHRLTGHWKDELVYLEADLKKLEQQRADFKAEGAVVMVPQYKAAQNADNGKLFEVKLQKISDFPIGQPLTIHAEVSANAGIKWVRLRYRSVNQMLDYSTLPMVGIGKNKYQATIPANEINAHFDLMYFIEVMDKNSNGKIYPDMNRETPYVIVNLKR